MKNIALISFTSKGSLLANKLADSLNDNYLIDIYDKEKETIKDFVKRKFTSCDGIVFVSATGIAVRLIAPYIESKDKDPAVVVIDDCGKNVISLLSGHLGGGNRLAKEIAVLIDANPVITTATDVNNKFAVDEWSKEAGVNIGDISKIKHISSAVLEGEEVGLYSDFDVRGEIPKGITVKKSGKTGICVSLDENKKPFDETLSAIPKIITLGVGCRRDTSFEVFESRVLEELKKRKISLKAIEKVVSIDLKKDEKCILEFCKKYGLEFQTFTAKELMSVEGDFEVSEFVKKTTGCDNVCERSAVCYSKGKLIMRKNGGEGVTCALAIREWECRF